VSPAARPREPGFWPSGPAPSGGRGPGGGGAALAERGGSSPSVRRLAALVGALLIQVATNLANDYFDFLKGTDTEDRVGPTRVVQAGLLSPDRLAGRS
jgi:1,4-dihydroxy-2-naphthoate octaprenyltransferase